MMAKKKIESKTKKAAAAILGFPKIFAKREAFSKQKIAALRPLKTIICAALLALACASLFAQAQVIVGAARFDKYKKLLKNKRVALAANATSIIVDADGGAVHDLDFLLSKKINVVKVFAPEHGFRGKGEAGETIANDVDQKTGVPILGIIENMSYFVCPHCGEYFDIFGHSGAERTAKKLGETFLGAIPLQIEIRENADNGTPIVAALPDSPQAQVYEDIALKIAQQLK